MIPDQRFRHQSKAFWAHVKILSEHIGYTYQPDKGKKKSTKHTSLVRVPQASEIKSALADLELARDHIEDNAGHLTRFGCDLIAYFEHRADAINTNVRQLLMNRDEAKAEYEKLAEKCKPTCHQPRNKQTGEKKGPAYFTCIVNMLIEANASGMPCNYDPRELTAFTKNQLPVRALSRRVDGAFPSTVNPSAIWEIKEYYYTTTFGSRVADGIYETLLDGFELNEIRVDEDINVKHYLMVDARDTWWLDGKSYLCRIIDMLHMGYIDEVLFGREVIDRIPNLVESWMEIANQK